MKLLSRRFRNSNGKALWGFFFQFPRLDFSLSNTEMRNARSNYQPGKHPMNFSYIRQGKNWKANSRSECLGGGKCKYKSRQLSKRSGMRWCWFFLGRLAYDGNPRSVWDLWTKKSFGKDTGENAGKNYRKVHKLSRVEVLIISPCMPKTMELYG